jgi:hypothetical protein
MWGCLLVRISNDRAKSSMPIDFSPHRFINDKIQIAVLVSGIRGKKRQSEETLIYILLITGLFNR